ncbi:hypothetical protein C2E23DRAFT_828793 [Lenzites betulinus]|nr:hypothetical protein C2E23DRAFT_828793 [Lenzites betulinus]
MARDTALAQLTGTSLRPVHPTESVSHPESSRSLCILDVVPNTAELVQPESTPTLKTTTIPHSTVDDPVYTATFRVSTLARRSFSFVLLIFVSFCFTSAANSHFNAALERLSSRPILTTLVATVSSPLGRSLRFLFPAADTGDFPLGSLLATVLTVLDSVYWLRSHITAYRAGRHCLLSAWACSIHSLLPAADTGAPHSARSLAIPH